MRAQAVGEEGGLNVVVVVSPSNGKRTHLRRHSSDERQCRFFARCLPVGRGRWRPVRRCATVRPRRGGNQRAKRGFPLFVKRLDFFNGQSAKSVGCVWLVKNWLSVRLGLDFGLRTDAGGSRRRAGIRTPRRPTRHALTTAQRSNSNVYAKPGIKNKLR